MAGDGERQTGKEFRRCLPTAHLCVEEQTQIHKQSGILELLQREMGSSNPESHHTNPAIPNPKQSLSPAIPTDLVRGIPFRREPGSFSGPGRPWRSNNDCGGQGGTWKFQGTGALSFPSSPTHSRLDQTPHTPDTPKALVPMSNWGLQCYR